MIPAIPTTYSGVNFRSRLEARWAAFFDLAEWRWEYEPIDLAGWIPDFWVRFRCGHSECGGGHELHGEVRPYRDVGDWTQGYGEFKGHRVAALINNLETAYTPPHPAMLGLTPEHTGWQMAHGNGGGWYTVPYFVDEPWEPLWKEAGNRVQWQRARR